MSREHQWRGIREWAAANEELIEALHVAVVDGPVSAGELDAEDRKKGPWWGWGDTKRALSTSSTRAGWRPAAGQLRAGLLR